MQNHNEEVTPLVLNLPPSVLRRRSIEDPLRDTHTHRALPVLKRSATTTPNGRSRSYRFPEIENLQPLTTTGGPHWASPSPSASSGRRPSFVDHERSRMRRTVGADVGSVSSEPRLAEISVVEPDSPEDGTNFRRSMEINMKDLVGDAVGNMSISPYSRDIVLAARRGLFIIDLENPLEVPRFLPQGGTWDVADVQWNPHSSRSQYIVSTSSEKMLIWNLNITGKTSIEHILRSHYRAITDFNWHTTECDIVASTGIDSWIFVWDMRNPRKPAFGLSAFKNSGTQVKWNRQDANFLASAHGNEVLIWDRRKGSLPMTRISAHHSKIYGIDWSHHLRNEIVTCSLDKTIKTWDTNDCNAPKSCIETDYPVWRARNLPFGQGVLSLPQRGETRLEMFARGESPTLVETFDGHSDVVKEFVWRKGAPDEFQLITWSKDRTLRFWPVSPEVMQNVGYSPEIVRGRSHLRLDREATISYRNPPESKGFFPMLSAPIGNRGILAEVRAGLPPRSANLITQPHLGSSARGTATESTSQLTPTLLSETKPIPVTRTRGGTMSRGAVTGKSVARMDALVWISNVRRVGNKRGGSSGAGSAELESSSSSRLNSRSRPPSTTRGESESVRHRSPSRSRGGEERREGENTQSLQDEITTVLNKLASSKVKTEKIDLTKKRTCTLGLHGPWGERSSVFVRVTFTFPPKYPQAGHPEGTPTVELERSPLISIRDRAYILKRLRAIRERKRPCLEACLRFLLFAEEDQEGRAPIIDSESSDDEQTDSKGTGKEFTVSILRNHKNLAEPRTSQGTFGPNGELICFFRAPPRIVRNVLRGLSDASPKPNTEEQQPQQSNSNAQAASDQQQPQQSRLFQSPALVSDAIRRLSLAAKDRVVQPIDPRKPENDLNILRTMTNLLTVSQHKVRRDSIASGMTKNWSLLPTRRSNVFMMDTTNISGPDRIVGVDYVFQAASLIEVCEKNAGVARERGRFDHERVFRTVQALFKVPEKREDGTIESVGNVFASEVLAAGVVLQLYSDLSKAKDIQMLAMLSVIILQTPYASTAHLRVPPPIIPIKTALDIPIGARLPPIKTGFDYFSLARSINNAPSPMSPAWPSFGGGNSAGTGTPSPIGGPPIAPPSVASSNSSRGSWSSLFNPQHVRQFVSGVQDSIKDGLTTPSAEVPASAIEAQMMAAAKMNEKAALGGGLGAGTGAAPGGGGPGGGPGVGPPLGPGFPKPNSTAALGAAFAANIAGSVLVEKRNKRRVRKDSSMHSTATANSGSTGTTHSLSTNYPSTRNSSVVSRSWNEGQQPPYQPRRSLSGSFSSNGPPPRYYLPQFTHQRSMRSVVKLREAERAFREKQKVIFEPAIVEESPQPLFSPEVLQQMRRHVLIYAELLFRWQLYNKRMELLNAIDRPRPELEREEEQHRIGLMRMCPRPDCRMLLDAKTRSCLQCNASAPLPGCTICRLPVKERTEGMVLGRAITRQQLRPSSHARGRSISGTTSKNILTKGKKPLYAATRVINASCGSASSVFARCWVHSTNKTSALLRKVKASGLKRAYSTKQAAEGGNGLPGGSATGLPLYRKLMNAWTETPTKWYPLPLAVGALLLVAIQYRKKAKRARLEADLDENGMEVIRLKGPWHVHVIGALPLRNMSRLWGYVNSMELPVWFRPYGYRFYAYAFGCNLDEIEPADLRSYPSLGAFFYRKLKAGARPVDPAILVSPADGTILHFGTVQGMQVEQVKGITYHLDALLGVERPGHAPSLVEHNRDMSIVDDQDFANVNGIEYSLEQLIGTSSSSPQSSGTSTPAFSQAPPVRPPTEADALLAHPPPKKYGERIDASVVEPDRNTVAHDASVAREMGVRTSMERKGSLGARNLRPGHSLFFTVIYLAPGDYHRFHSPTAWVVEKRRHFVGELFSVSPWMAKRLENLFVLNERVALLGRWRHGFFGMVPVGATNVGSIKVNFDQTLRTNVRGRPPPPGTFSEAVYSNASPILRGQPLNYAEEMGGFCLGSTIVLVFEAPSDFEFTVHAGQKVKVGERLGDLADELAKLEESRSASPATSN